MNLKPRVDSAKASDAGDVAFCTLRLSPSDPALHRTIGDHAIPEQTVPHRGELLKQSLIFRKEPVRKIRNPRLRTILPGWTTFRNLM